MITRKIFQDRRFYWGLGLSVLGVGLIIGYVNRRKIEKAAGNIASAARAVGAKYSKQFINYLGQVGQLITAPRGIRNNNPGNINQTTSLWNGEVSKEENTDGRFKQFYDFTYGVRALMLNLKSYFNNGKNTVRKIIETWSPAGENGAASTEAYVLAVSKAMGVKPEATLTWNAKTAGGLAKAISQHENGKGDQWVTDDHVNKAWNLLS